jgi:hypothetical protein
MRRIIMSFILAASLLFAPSVALAQNTSNPTSSDFVRIVRVDANGNGTQGAVSIVKVFEGVGIGYNTGSAVVQGTSRTTGVTINAYAGSITMFSAAGSATAASFTVTDSSVRATDTVVLSVKSATNLYVTSVTAVAAGSFQVSFFTTGGTATDAPVINFAVVRSAAS